jgi:peptidoglycan/LPS O-acetylase OafA/YrhL
MAGLNPGATSESDPAALAERSHSARRDPGKQRRQSSGIPLIPAFDGFRAFAVLGVVMVHICIISGFLPFQNDSWPGLLAWGTLGQALDMLFIISGFVIYLPVAVRRGSFGNRTSFAIRRWARLFPAYWTVIAIMLLLILLVPVTPAVPFPSPFDVFLLSTTLEVPADMFRHVFYLGFGINRALWTLHSEVCFYVMLPFVAGWYFRRPFLGLAIAAAITSAWKLTFVNLDQVNTTLGLGMSQHTVDQVFMASEIQFPAWIFSIAMGMTCAWLFVELRQRYSPERLLRYGRRAALGFGMALAVFVYLAGDISRNAPFLLAPEYARHSPLMAIGFSFSLASLMLAITFCGTRVQWPFANRAATWIADSSVGIYMMHLVIISYTAFLVDLPQNGSLEALVVWTAIVMPLSIGYGFLSARFMEQPVRRRAQVFAKRLAARPLSGPVR